MKVAEAKTSAAQIQAKEAPHEQPFFAKQNGAEPAFFSKNGGVAQPFFSPGTIQPKLKIGSPNDVYERQADAVADQVVAKLNAPPAPAATPAIQAKGNGAGEEEQLQKKEEAPEKTGEELQRKPIFESVAPPPPAEEGTVQRKCATCEQEEKLQKKEEETEQAGEELQMKPIFGSDAPAPPDEENVQRKCAECGKEHEKVQRKSGNESGEATASPEISSRLQSSKGGGSPLPAETRSQMEGAMGADFSGVRVHTGSEAAGLNKELSAQAFAHGSDIYFNEGKYNPGSTDGQRLLAHELTHTVQQGGSVGKKEKIQAKLNDYEQPGHGKNATRRLNAEIERQTGEQTRETPTREVNQAARNIDRRQKAEKVRELRPTGTPEINESRKQTPNVKKAQAQAKSKIEKPKQEKGAKSKKPSGKRNAQNRGLGHPQEHISKSRQAMVKANAIAPPQVPREVQFPEVFRPEDAKGQPLPLDVNHFSQAAEVLQSIQEIRIQGYQLQIEGGVHEAQSHAMEANIHTASGLVAESEQNLGTIDHAISQRQEVLQQGQHAHSVADDKQKKVEAEAPKYLEKVNSEKAESGEMVTKNQSLQNENNSAQPEDPEDRSNSEEMGGQLAQVGSGAQTIDQTYTEASANTQSLINQTGEAKGKNTDSKAKLDVIGQQLNQSADKSQSLHLVNQQASQDIQGRTGEPGEVREQAIEMKMQGQNIVANSFMMEERLHQSIRQYQQSLKNVPPLFEPEADTNNRAGGTIQRQATGDYADRQDVFEDTFLDPRTHQSQEERARAQQEAAASSAAELNYIRAQLPGDVRQYSRWQRIGVGLGAKFNNLGRWFHSLSFGDVVGGVGHAILAMFNPMTYIGGIVHGFTQVVNGVVNLVSDIARGNWWGVLKSAADIATGIAMIAGTITGIALLLELAMTALIIFTLGAGAPFAVAVMAVAGNVMAFTGPIAFWAGLTAAALNYYAGIKSLVDMGNAESAEQLQAETNDFTQDAAGVAGGLMNALVGRAGMKASAGMPSSIAAAEARAAALQSSVATLGRAATYRIVAREIAVAIGEAVTLKGARKRIGNWWRGGEAASTEAAAGATVATEEGAAASAARGGAVAEEGAASRAATAEESTAAAEGAEAAGAGPRRTMTNAHGETHEFFVRDGRVIRCSEFCGDAARSFGQRIRMMRNHPELAEEAEALNQRIQNLFRESQNGTTAWRQLLHDAARLEESVSDLERRLAQRVTTPNLAPIVTEIPTTPVVRPHPRHFTRRVNQGSSAADLNTVIEPNIPVAEDMAAINRGEATAMGRTTGGEKTYTVNGRTYGVHPNGKSYPISGPGFITLDRGGYKALGVYNEVGVTSRAEGIIDNIGVSQEQRALARQAYEMAQK